jgi:hypothetical protein
MKSLIIVNYRGVILTGLLFLFFSTFSSAQDLGMKYPSVKSFVTVSGTEDNQRFFNLDLTEMPDKIERAFLLEYIFADPTVVIVRTDISGDVLQLISNVENAPELIVGHLETYKVKALAAAKELSPDSRNELLKKYEKYW